jgi:diguanylate cyclase (GGDEF)-like protein
MLLLLQDCRLDQALSIANDIRKDVEHMQMQIEGKLTSTTISAGVAEMSGEESEDSVIARADSALYAAKKAGRNKVMSEYAEKERAASH